MKFLKDLLQKINERFGPAGAGAAAFFLKLLFIARAFALLVIMLLLAASNARADAAGDAKAQSFNTTNNLVNGVNYANYPTNASGIATGGAINIDNYNTIGIYFDADVSNNAAAKVWFPLVRTHRTPAAAQCTTNWETTSVYGCFISVPAMTNHFTWLTNLPNDFAGCGRELGLGGLTNNFASGQLATNVDIGVVKRIVPMVYP